MTNRGFGAVQLILVSTVISVATVTAVPAASDWVQSARAAGGADSGKAVARQVCADCHRLPDGTGGGYAPPLTELRGRQSFTAEELRRVVGSAPHAGRVELPADPAYAKLAAYLNKSGDSSQRPDGNHRAGARDQAGYAGGAENDWKKDDADDAEHEAHEEEYEAYEDD